MGAEFEFDELDDELVHVKGYELPSVEEIIFAKIADTMMNYTKMANVFKDNFELNENQQRFQHMLDTSELPPNEVMYCLIYGDIGSGKTWLVLQHVLDKMLCFPKLRAIAVRRTAGDIEQSIYRETIEFFEQYNVPYKKNDKNLLITLANRSYIHMRSDQALVQPDKIKSDALGSQYFSFAILEEADSCTEELFNTMPARMRQNISGFRKIVFLICNPPDKNHWIYKKFFVNNNGDDPRSPFRTLYCTQAGNAKNLPAGYAESMQKFYEDNPGLQGAFLGGVWSPQVKGDPIFAENFNKAVHVSSGPLAFNPNFPVCRMWDYGFRGNACHFGQMDFDRQQIRILKSIFAEKMTLDPFADIVELRSAEWFPVGTTFEDWGDSSGKQQTAHGLSLHDTLRQRGIITKFFPHQVQYGIEIMHRVFKQMAFRKGKEIFAGEVKPFFLISNCPECEHLISAISIGYCNKKGTPKGEFNPVKDGFYDHPIDALRYWLVPLMRHLDKKGYDIHQRPMPHQYTQGDAIIMDGNNVVGARKQRPTHGYRAGNKGKSFFGKSWMR